MKKKTKFVFSCFFGAMLGLTIAVIITIVISVILHDGKYYAVPPELIGTCGNEINAVMIQTILSLFYGAAWGGASWIWSIDRWSILRQTITHLVICSAATLPVAYFAYWMPHNIRGILIYFGIFFVIYLIIWIFQYSSMKKRLQQINEKLHNNLDKKQ
ncbi:DUF3021 domain-containing protein [Caproicibacterium sp. NSD3]